MTLEERSAGERVLIADTTLRDEHLVARDPRLLADKSLTEIWRSNTLPIAKRVVVARQLAALGVDVIEAGFGDTTSGLDAIHALACEFQDEGPVVSVLVRTMGSLDQIDASWKAVSAAARPRIHLYTSASDLVDDFGHFRTDPQRLFDDARAAIERAKSYTGDVEFSPPRTASSDVEIIAEWTQVAINEGVRTINVRTTDEYATPEGYRAVLLELSRLAPQCQDVTLSADPFVAHLRGAEAMAAALECAETAVGAGCRQVKCAFHGVAGTPGHAPLELIAFNVWLRNHLGKSALWTHTDTRRILATSDVVADAKGYDVPPSQPLVGSEATNPQRANFADDPLERALAADSFRIVLRALGRPIPAWLDECADASSLDL
jgi:2-isopropylmalate synthase